MNEFVAVTCMGMALDRIMGDPRVWWHPVRLMGRMVAALEPRLRGWFPRTERGELAAGAVLVCCVAGGSTAAAGVVLWAAGLFHPVVSRCLAVALCGFLLAAKSLRAESGAVYEALQQGDVGQARDKVSMIVGRDTSPLDRNGIIRAAVETVAENASDGVIAPMLWMLVFGPLGGVFYKAVNTMDSMVGYRNQKYQYFGRMAAKLDDVANWLPARITALLFVLAACILPGFRGRDAWRIWRRDCRNHSSPNSAQGESACAGALGVMLAGDAWYFGVLHKKPTIGDALRPVEAEDILRAGRLMDLAAVLGLVLGAGGILWTRGCMAAMFTAIR